MVISHTSFERPMSICSSVMMNSIISTCGCAVSREKFVLLLSPVKTGPKKSVFFAKIGA